MGVCDIIYSGLCLFLGDVSDVSYERDRGAIFGFGTDQYHISLIRGHHIRSMNQNTAPKICHDGVCAYYHQSCENIDEQQICSYYISRDNRCEFIQVIAVSNGQKLPDNWRNHISVFFDTEYKFAMPLARFDELGAFPAVPEYKSRQETQKHKSSCK